MRVYSDFVPEGATNITAGKRYEFKPEKYGFGTIMDDDGVEIYIATEHSAFNCSHLNDYEDWKFDEDK